jgi:hypothetical protein
MVATNKELVYDDPDRCVKDDESATGPCMCPACLQLIATSGGTYIEKGIVLTDDSLVAGGAVTRTSFHFVCADCGKDHVADFMSYCPDCGIRVVIRSHVVFKFLQKYHATLNKNDNN